ncbi:hypothetical protein [Streptomyces sp. NPDC006997]|uniref:hypothetical protein n=1 Tax=Streptomyces sp. NPDC006997 TaxID=3155356 RepID=UPI0033E4E921
MTPLTLLLIFGVLVAGWWVLCAVLEVLADRRVHLPERVMVRVLPGWLPTYVRQDLARARAARAARTAPPLPDAPPWAHADHHHTRPTGRHRREGADCDRPHQGHR